MFTLEEVERVLGIDSDDEYLLQKVFFIVAEDVDDVEDMKSINPEHLPSMEVVLFLLLTFFESTEFTA